MQCSTLPMAIVVSPASGLNFRILNLSENLLWNTCGEEVGRPGQQWARAWIGFCRLVFFGYFL
ncbi:hypothetical protein MMU07_20815 [Aquiflexum sp. LQ15W]|uniref:hypothetical protein n=1 Tax=Cognataquiflexum nitidum TaxID=2922272 RepID=UPI001F142610|nr:hypothetical protein [Cognataquiflexum nitidum]MCH6202031.1 hypothetical protein [Cognataquiflexum nitidum]